MRRYIRLIVSNPLSWSAGAGTGLALAFPQPGWSALAWVAPAAMVWIGLTNGGRNAFRWGYAAGLAHFLVGLGWLLYIPFLPGAIAGWLALGAYTALFPAAWVWVCVRTWPATHRDPEDASSLTMARRLVEVGWGRRTLWAIGGAAAWVGLELLRCQLFSGFPWNPLGVSQCQMLPLLQVAEWTGVYGVSFLVIWFSLALLLAAFALVGRPRDHWAWRVDLALPALVLGALFVLGLRQTLVPERPDRVLRVAVVQPSIPQTLIWDPAESTNRFRQLIALSETALKERPDLLLWPEAAVPNLLRYDETTYGAITNLVGSHAVWTILGADDAEPRAARPGEADADYFNSSFLLQPDGRVAADYRKRRLVIFGEYVPFTDFLPFLRRLTPIQGVFAAGDRPGIFRLGNLGLATSVLICFEDVFPHGVRDHVTEEVDFLVNLTNDGWFGESSAHWQQAASAVFRAVESRRPLIRCTNNGITCWIDAQGRMRQVFRDARGSVYGPGQTIFEVPVRQQGQGRTFYTRHGDVFAWSCLSVTLLALALRRRWPGDRLPSPSYL